MMENLVIGNKSARLPIIQGGMGVGVSLSKLAGAVAAEGGVGVISTAQIGYGEPGFEDDPKACNRAAIEKHVKLAKEQADGGLVGVNIMAALKDYEEPSRSRPRRTRSTFPAWKCNSSALRSHPPHRNRSLRS